MAHKDPEWWHTDSKGRRIGWMWPEDFKVAIDAIWGHRKGIAGFARYAGLGRTTVEYYANGQAAIPKHIALLITAMQMLVPEKGDGKRSQVRTRYFPKVAAPWLEKDATDEKKLLAKRPFG